MLHFLKNSQIFITAFMLVVGVTFSVASTAEAASEQMTFKQTLAQLETTLRQLLSNLSPAPEVAGAAVIQVSNDQELQQAIATVTGGETIQLRPATYGFITIRQDRYSKIIVGTAKGPARIAKLTAPVTVTSADVNNRAQIKGLAVTESPLWRFEGLSFRPDPKKTAVQLYSNDVVFTKNDITYGDATNWDKDDWNAITGSGVDVRAGSNVEVSFNTLKNINFGIIVYHAADRVKVVGNVIDSFNGDAMRGLADNSVFENNLVQNALQTNANHSDGFQSWRNYKNNNRPVENVTVRNNTFLYQTEPHSLRASMQGVGMFDGPFKNWTIENNLFVLNTWHGISIYGGINSVLRNNFVIDPDQIRPGPPWVRFNNTKAGAVTVNSKIINNYGSNIGGPGVGVESTGNVKVLYSEYDKYFVDYKKNDWRIKSGVLPFLVGATIGTSAIPLTQTPSKTTPTSVLPKPTVSNSPTPADSISMPSISTSPTPVTSPTAIPSTNTKQTTLINSGNVQSTSGDSAPGV